MSTRPLSRRLPGPLAPLLLAGMMLPVACGGDADPGPAASPEERGEALAASRGCLACHGLDGAGGAGPSWRGLVGSERILESGRTVVADRAYLERAISDPGAERVEGYTVEMPEAELSDAELDDLVAYVESVS